MGIRKTKETFTVVNNLACPSNSYKRQNNTNLSLDHDKFSFLTRTMDGSIRDMMSYDADLFGFWRIFQKIHDDFVAFCKLLGCFIMLQSQ